MKILYVGYILFGDDSATGNTLNNIYKDSDFEILQCCTDYDLSRHSTKWPSLCVSKTRSFVYFLLRGSYRRFIEKQTRINTQIANAISGHHKSPFASFAQGLMDIAPKRLGKTSLTEIDQFKPDVIYTLAENITVLRLSEYFSRRYSAPIVCHIMDDIESTIYTESTITRCFRNKYKSILERVYSNNNQHLAIGEKMASEFERRHNCSYYPAMNCIFKVYPSEQPMNSPLKIIFSGGLHGGRTSSLLTIANVINEDEQLKSYYELHVYTDKNSIISNPELSNACNVHEYVPAEKMIDNLSSADILLHVESFQNEEIEYFRYSMSTKLPEYLSVGRPILCFGPIAISTVSFIKEHEVGIVAESVNNLKAALYSLLNESIRRDYAKSSISTAEALFLDQSVRTRIKEVFNNSINSR